MDNQKLAFEKFKKLKGEMECKKFGKILKNMKIYIKLVI